MEQVREEFVHLACSPGANRRELCRRFGVSPTTCYKWLSRDPCEGFSDRSRRPASSPGRTPEAVERLVLDLRAEHPGWGARKLRRRLEDLGHAGLPSPSTITQILRRHDALGGRAGSERDWRRFEREAPNALWQMDFKGHFGLSCGDRCHPFTLLDDCSRYSLAVAACADERFATVQSLLWAAFARYGLPEALLCDNGAPWGGSGQTELTRLEVWLLRVGVSVCHGSPFHPQTQGKLERFHRTLKAEAIQGRPYKDLDCCQKAFDSFRRAYNFERPHEACAMATPASRYRPSARPMPERLPEPEYDSQDAVRKVQIGGEVNYRGVAFDVPRALAGQKVGIRPAQEDGFVEIRFFREVVARVDLRYHRR